MRMWVIPGPRPLSLLLWLRVQPKEPPDLRGVGELATVRASLKMEMESHIAVLASTQRLAKNHGATARRLTALANARLYVTGSVRLASSDKKVAELHVEAESEQWHAMQVHLHTPNAPLSLALLWGRGGAMQRGGVVRGAERVAAGVGRRSRRGCVVPRWRERWHGARRRWRARRWRSCGGTAGARRVGR